MSDTDTTGMEFVQKSEKDTWQTPDRILDPIQRFVGIDIDPCPGENTDIGAVNLRPPDQCGLNDPWVTPWVIDEPTAFMNPPFSRKGKFIERAIHQYQVGNVDRVLILTPASPTVKSWWGNQIAAHCRYTWFPAGRVNYIDPETGEQVKNVPFGSALSILGDIPEEFEAWMRGRGDFVERATVE